MQSLPYLEIIVGYLVCVIVGMFGLVLVWKIASNQIDLTSLLSDEDNKASTSRFQLIIFTFVVALSFFLVVVSNVKIRQNGGSLTSGSEQNQPPLPDVPGGVLALLGISASSYLVSRGISASTNGNGQGTSNADPNPKPNPNPNPNPNPPVNRV
jgi:amino acid transporter